MFKKSMLATIVSMVLLSGAATAARPDRDLRQFNVVMDGVIETSDAGVVSGLANFGNNRRAIDFSLMPFNLGDYWRNYTYENEPQGGGGYCFPVDSAGNSEIGDAPYIQIYEIKGGGMGAAFYFKSPPGDEVKYMLTLTDAQGAFPDSDSFDLNFEAWTMETEGRGQKRKSACTGSGPELSDREYYIKMKITRIPYP